MAGYMTKLQGYVYEGTLKNGAANPVPNGLIMDQGLASTSPATNDSLVLPAADSGAKFLCMEVTDIYGGVTAYRFQVQEIGKRHFLVENSFQFNVEDFQEYDKRNYTQPVGELMRAHALLLGEEFVTTCVTGTPVPGTVYTLKADGTIG